MSDETSKSIPKRSMIEKYGIPIEFLDFDYINKCNDDKMMEKIVKILRSGEEGFYPQLTAHAEKKLTELKPHSKYLRKEFKVKTSDGLEDDEKKKFEDDMTNWLKEMKEMDGKVKEIQPKVKSDVPIRNFKKMGTENSEKNLKTVERIKSTDYNKWDKFDAEAAVMKIDLDDERQLEMVATKNQKNIEKTKLIEEIRDDEVDGLSEFEKDFLCNKFKEKGNECFKVREYDEAVKEYTQSLRVKKTAAAFNNRALIYLKQKKFLNALSDTNECLKIEPGNVKALLRKAQAFIGENQLYEAFDVYEKILEIEPDNRTAKSEMEKIRYKCPPKNAFRMTIEDVSDIGSKETESKPAEKVIRKTKEKLEVESTASVPKLVQNIVVDEPTLFDKFKPKTESKSREKLIMPGNVNEKQQKNKILIEELS